MSRYQTGKNAARATAQEWQADFNTTSRSYSELAEDSARFERLGHRFGLLREFRENGII